ncbi:hypothetical protein [Gloeothece verrucosa]|uniref:hypothetical protein n=1 Tax=Gloeothece verrucosa TaxID=2546359 RepID=UPI00017E2E61|nr:hypothetical protein [Gloeothece verrucosa]
MKPSKILYLDLKNLLLKLGFFSETITGNHQLFQHPSGALIVLPSYQDKDYVYLIHLAAIHHILKKYSERAFLLSMAKARGTL